MKLLPDTNAATAADPSAEFAAWMAELDALQVLRFREPERALARVQARRGLWSLLPAAEDALLRARFTLQAGAAHLLLGQHAQAQRELQQLDQELAVSALQTAAPGLQHQAQRCGIAGANAQAVLTHALGDFAGALRCYLRALDLAVAVGDRRYQAHVLVNLSNTFEECGLPAEALEHSRQALALAQDLAMDELVGDIHHNIGNALAASGDAEAGLASNRRALDAYAALKLPQKESYALVAVAERLLELGRLADADAALRDREQRALSFVNHQYVAYAAYLQGRINTAQGRPDAARHAFLQALSVSAGQLDDRVGQARAHLELARLDLAAGSLATAGEQATTALALLTASQAQRDLMQAHSLLSAVAKAQGNLAAALRHHEAFHAGYEHCFNEESARKALVLAVRHAVDLARSEAQRQQLENARLTEALAAIASRLQARESRARPDAAAGAARGGAEAVRAEDLRALGLTAREAEVLFWVTQGKTNEDVTVILGTSISAVKKHLGRIYEKLGVENRTAAANAARRALPGAAQP